MALNHFDDEGPVSFSVSRTHIFIEHGPYKLSSSLIEGEFPEYRKVIPENQKHTCLTNRDDMLKAVKRASVVADRGKRVCLEIKPGLLAMYTERGEIGDMREEIVCKYEGPDTLIALNCRYLEDAYKAIESETVSLCFTGEKEVITLKPSVGEYFHIIVPMWG
jgi:DNA polymerase-3 subunit beta